MAAKGTDTASGIKAVRGLGLDALELEFVQSVNISRENAPKIKAAAEKESVALTCHAPYYINLNAADDAKLEALLERLEDSELDEYTDIITLIGIEFDENTAWGQLTILELKLLIHLALQQFETAHELVGSFLQYNENTVERGLFYQALNVVLEVLLDDELELDDYVVNFRRMFGNPRMDAVLGSVDGSVRFFGLTPTSMNLEGLDRHQRLIDSYKKLHVARASVAA